MMISNNPKITYAGGERKMKEKRGDSPSRETERKDIYTPKSQKPKERIVKLYNMQENAR